MEAARQAGLPITDDYNGASGEGFGRSQYTIRNGRRSSTANAFLRPAEKRRNLRVETSALTTRVLMDGKIARGVEYMHHGMKVSVNAERERVANMGEMARRRREQFNYEKRKAEQERSAGVGNKPRTGGGFELRKDAYDSAEISDKRMTADSRHGVRRSMGEVDAELSVQSFDAFWEGIMGGTWNTGVTLTGGGADFDSLAANGTTNVLTFAGLSGDHGLQFADRILIANAAVAGLNGTWTVIAASAANITVAEDLPAAMSAPNDSRPSATSLASTSLCTAMCASDTAGRRRCAHPRRAHAGRSDR